MPKRSGKGKVVRVPRVSARQTELQQRVAIIGISLLVVIILMGVGLYLAPGAFVGKAHEEASCTPADEVIAWWDGSTSLVDRTALDFSFHRHHGSVSGEIPPSSDLVFDGINDYITIPDSSALELDYAAGFTIEGWINPDTDGPKAILTHFTTGDRGTGYALSLGKIGVGSNPHDLALNNKLYFLDNRNGRENLVIGSTNIPANQWTHIAVVGRVKEDDATTTSIKLYVNGQQINLEQENIREANFLASHSEIPDAPVDLYLGADPFRNFDFRGRMRGLRLYQRALQTEEIQQLVADGTLRGRPIYENSLAARWEGAVVGQAVNDVRSLHQGLFYGVQSSLDNSVHTDLLPALSFPDTANNFIEVPSHPDFNFGSAPFTIESWIKANPGGILLSKYTPSTPGSGVFYLYVSSGFYLFVSREAGVSCGRGLCAWSSGTGEGLSGPQTIDYIVPTDTWFHLTAVRQGTQMQFYIDGESVGAVSVKENIGSSSYPLLIGTRARAPPQDIFQGDIDELTIYRAALTPEQVRTNYQAGLEGRGKCRDEAAYQLCHDETDNDGDGSVDCNDADCRGLTTTFEISPAESYDVSIRGDECAGTTLSLDT